MPLAELEQAFWRAVRQRGAPPPGLSSLFTASPKQSATERLAVYHRAYWQRQLTGLSQSFARSGVAFGADKLETLLLAYVEARPGEDPCIERQGAGFVEYLAERADIDATSLGLARLEWASVEALLAPDAPEVAELPRGLGERLAECRLTLVPSLRVEHVPHAALLAFEDQTEKIEDADPASLIHVAFFRPRFMVQRARLADDEAQAHTLARSGAMFSVICEAFSALPEQQAAVRAWHVLSSWFGRGWIARCAP